MSRKEYINYNGKLVLKSENIFGIDNRVFKYGDCLYESMHATANNVQLFEQHLERLRRSMQILKMDIPSKFSSNRKLLHREINRLTNKNLQFKGSRIRLSVFRNLGELYAPDKHKITYTIESNALETNKYLLNKKGLFIDTYNEHLKPVNLFSALKSTNSLLFVMADIFKEKHELDECLILNTEGNVIESINSNVFLVKNGKIYTPSLEEGCLPGIMRQNIIKLVKSLNIELESNKVLKISDFEKADEVFLTNAVSGIQWVVGFKNKRYYNKLSKKLINALNLQLIIDNG